MPPILPAPDAAALLARSGTVLIAGCAAEPRAVLQAVAADPTLWRGVTVTGAFIPGVNETDFAGLVPGGRVETIFTTDGLRLGGGPVAHLPLHYTAYWARLARPGQIGAAVMTVPPPTRDGTVGMGLACDFLPAAIQAGAQLVGVINPRMPDVANGPRLPLSRFAALVEEDSPLRTLPSAAPDAVNLRIAEWIVGLLREGDTLQLGLGRFQAAMLAVLGKGAPGRLGYHAGMIAPGILTPGLFPRGITTGVALGDPEFYEAVARTPTLRFRPVGETHSIATLAALPGLVSVNSALEVDLSGQVNAEYLGGQFSGQGGMVDFIRGARASAGGRAIIALPSTARNGAQSRIVARFDPRAPVSVARSDVDLVVTEHGIADLREADLAERARRLAAIADPVFRDTLLAAARTHSGA